MTKTIICILAYNRPEYLVKVLHSLERAKDVENYPIICSIDAGEPKKQLEIETLLQESNLEIEYHLHEENQGCAGNMRYLLSWAFNEKKADRVIVIEDDIVLAEDALQLADICLNKYEHDERFFSISLMSENRRERLDETKLRCLDWFNCFGWATWKRVWDEIDSEGWFGTKLLYSRHTYNKKWVWDHIKENHFNLKGSWAWPMTSYWIKGRIVMEPEVSRTQNIGKHGIFTGDSERSEKWHSDNVEHKVWMGDGTFEYPNLNGLVFPHEDDIQKLYEKTQLLGGNTE